MAIKIIVQNKKAFHDYFILETYEAGMVLKGSEVKSLRAGSAQLKDSYVIFEQDELFLLNTHISAYSASSYNNHVPERRRKLLMHKSEINKIIAQMKEKGLTVVPLKMYFKEGIAKVEIAIVKGKKAHDKRDSIKKRDVQRELGQAVRKSRG
ncbi:MAG: SsrA-binding protein SmpB [Oligoflexia bacterium]|nr:SsrA-binding protein SmpB [Oligoflexia bacterium]